MATKGLNSNLNLSSELINTTFACAIIARGINVALFDGIWLLRGLILSGRYEYFRLRPGHTLYHIILSRPNIVGIVDILLGITIICIYSSKITGIIPLTFLLYSILCASLIVLSMNVLGNSIAFLEYSPSNDAAFLLTNFVEVSRYPWTIFEHPMRAAVKLLPYAYIGYLPAKILLEQNLSSVATLTIISVISLAVSLYFWVFTSKKYSGVGQ